MMLAILAAGTLALSAEAKSIAWADRLYAGCSEMPNRYQTRDLSFVLDAYEHVARKYGPSPLPWNASSRSTPIFVGLNAPDPDDRHVHLLHAHAFLR